MELFPHPQLPATVHRVRRLRGHKHVASAREPRSISSSVKFLHPQLNEKESEWMVSSLPQPIHTPPRHSRHKVLTSLILRHCQISTQKSCFNIHYSTMNKATWLLRSIPAPMIGWSPSSHEEVLSELWGGGQLCLRSYLIASINHVTSGWVSLWMSYIPAFGSPQLRSWHCGAERRCQWCILPEFPSHRICEHNKMVVILHH